MKALIARIIILTLAGSGLAAQDAETTTRSVTFEELAATAVARGESIRVSGAYLELLDEDVHLFESPVAFVVKDPTIRRSILSLSAEHRNLTFEAVRRSSIEEAPRFEVFRVTAAPDSPTLLATEIETLESLGSDGSELLFALGKRILKTSEHFEDPTLGTLCHRACVAATEVAKRLLSPSDAAARLALVNRVFDVSGDEELAVELLAALEREYPGHEPVRTHLRKLGSRRFRGEWMTYHAFKQTQGFERYGSVWVSSREKDFLRSIFEIRTGEEELIVRQRTAAEYRVLASRGDLATGMLPQEVVDARGYADRVYHRDVGGEEYVQWVYDDLYCYFENGKLRGTTAR